MSAFSRPSPEPELWRARVGRLACRVAGAGVALIAPLGRWVVLAKDRVRPKYVAGVVVMSIERPLDRDRERLQDLVGRRWHSAFVVSPAWMGSIDSPSPPPDARLPIKHGTYWFATVRVDTGHEPFALALIRLDAIAALKFRQSDERVRVRDVLWVARWPNWQLDAPTLADTLSRETTKALELRAGLLGAQRVPTVAVIDTPFDAPPDIEVVDYEDEDDDEPLPVPPASPHGAVVCSLILGSCPTACIQLYPVLRSSDSADRGVDGTYVLSALWKLGMEPAPDLVNLSLSLPKTPYPEATRDELEKHFATIRAAHPSSATVFVASTGNEWGGPRMKLPARLPSTLAVGCVDRHGKIWEKSCGGKKSGEEPYRWLVSCGLELTYDGDGGTSYAAASVTGMLAVLVSQGCDPLEAANWLLDAAAKDLPEYSEETHGVGRARLGEAVY